MSDTPNAEEAEGSVGPDDTNPDIPEHGHEEDVDTDSTEVEDRNADPESFFPPAEPDEDNEED